MKEILKLWDTGQIRRKIYNSNLRATPKVFNSNYRPPKEKKSVNLKPYLFILLLLGLAVGVNLVTRLPFFNVSTIIINQTGQSDVVNEIESLRGKSIFSREVSSISNQILSDYFVVETINCRRGLPSTLRCDIEFRKPALIWQVGEVGKFLVDNSGVVYAEIKSISEEEQRALPTLVDNRNIKVELGQTVASRDLLKRYLESIATLNNQGFPTGSIRIDETFYYFYLELLPDVEKNISKPITLKLATIYSIEEQVAKITAILEKNQVVDQYIDVRVPGYAYAK